MYSHLVDLYCFPHALMTHVLASNPASTHHTGHLIENDIKYGPQPSAEKFMSAIRHLALGEQNYLLACFIAWASTSAFLDLVDRKDLPAEIQLAKRTCTNLSDFAQTNPEPEHDYDTYTYSPRDWRRRVLKLRGASCEQDVVKMNQQKYTVELSTSHARIVEVLRPSSVSTFSHLSQFAEDWVKRGERMPPKAFRDLYDMMSPSPEEQNYFATCYIAWSSQRQFNEALAAKVLPTLVYLAQDAGSDDGDYFYDYRHTPVQWRRCALNRRIGQLQREERELRSEVAGMDKTATR